MMLKIIKLNNASTDMFFLERCVLLTYASSTSCKSLLSFSIVYLFVFLFVSQMNLAIGFTRYLFHFFKNHISHLTCVTDPPFCFTFRLTMDILKSFAHPEELLALFRFKLGGCDAVIPKYDYVSTQDIELQIPLLHTLNTLVI